MKFPFGESLFSGTMLVAGRVPPLKILTPGAVDLLLPCSRPKLTTSNIKNNSPKSNNSYMGVSKNRGTPKWMVYNGKSSKLDDLGVPPFSETPI